jgi:hypothetical protein
LPTGRMSAVGQVLPSLAAGADDRI